MVGGFSNTDPCEHYRIRCSGCGTEIAECRCQVERKTQIHRRHCERCKPSWTDDGNDGYPEYGPVPYATGIFEPLEQGGQSDAEEQLGTAGGERRVSGVGICADLAGAADADTQLWAGDAVHPLGAVPDPGELVVPGLRPGVPGDPEGRARDPRGVPVQRPGADPVLAAPAMEGKGMDGVDRPDIIKRIKRYAYMLPTFALQLLDYIERLEGHAHAEITATRAENEYLEGTRDRAVAEAGDAAVREAISWASHRYGCRSELVVHRLDELLLAMAGQDEARLYKAYAGILAWKREGTKEARRHLLRRLICTMEDRTAEQLSRGRVAPEFFKPQYNHASVVLEGVLAVLRKELEALH
jgi:hypothetical protein